MKILKHIIVAILTLEAKLILKKYQPRIVAVTGSVGKTSTKEAIFCVLARKFNARRSEKSFNSELGVPLAVIGAPNAWYSVFGWLANIFAGLKLLVLRRPYPDILILELGADRQGDIARLADWVRPDIAVITPIGEVPVHVEFFAGPEDVAQEKAKLAEALTAKGTAVLNGDDLTVLEMRDKTTAKVITVGFGEDSMMRASEYKLVARTGGSPAGGHPDGITFKADYEGSSVPVRLHDVFGKQIVYAALSALGVGVAMGMNLIEAAEALSTYAAPAGRLKLIKGEKETWILDDTYNASPLAAHAALDVLKDFPARRKLAVLGDMLELGKFTIEAHRAMADHAKECADIVFTVGPRAKFIADELSAHGFDAEKLQRFSSAEEAGHALEKIIQPGDLILVKGSQSMRMERIVEEIMADPAEKEKLLVRQEPEWQGK
ncbi:MAG: UDP-N-acetylmuramoyl-tripeptide--D-alanyl-D-alanine ligase [Candidatus Niyogibacteria bacterium]|nr:UDP-N-acetylmuramoyl-tripeptide--D-alanyl-D-alanine ligase [Candidatus Niyogibacteria bacterium]